MPKQNENGLTEKQQRCADIAVKSMDGPQAYSSVYNCSVKQAKTGWARLMRKARFREYVEIHRRDENEKLNITVENVRAELARIAFFDIRKIYDEDGELMEINELDNDTARALSGADVMEVISDRGEGYDREVIKRVKRYRTIDKRKALELLGQDLGMWKDTDDDGAQRFEFNFDLTGKKAKEDQSGPKS